MMDQILSTAVVALHYFLPGYQTHTPELKFVFHRPELLQCDSAYNTQAHSLTIVLVIQVPDSWQAKNCDD